jgi:hypothetical protein
MDADRLPIDVAVCGKAAPKFVVDRAHHHADKPDVAQVRLRRGAWLNFRRCTQPIHAHASRDVFQHLLTGILEFRIDSASRVFMNAGRHADAAWLRDRLEPCGDVDPVAEQVLAVDHDIADMHANAELHLLIFNTADIIGRDRRLNRDRTLHGIDRAGEVGDDAVACSVEDAPAVRRDQSIDDRAARLQPGERANFVARHQTAVAGNVGGEDCGQFALYWVGGHARQLLIGV